MQVNNLKRYRDIALAALLVVVPFVVLRANMAKPANLNAFDRAIVRVSAPIEFAASSVARGVSGLLSDYMYLVNVKADNQRIEYENARMKESIHKLERHEVDNRELRRLLQLREVMQGEVVSANVVGTNFTEFFRVTKLMLDRGGKDIRLHQPVVSPDGVVGTVLRVTGDVVEVQLTVDAAFKLDVEDERTHARGFLVGTGDPARYACRVGEVDARDDVEVGDLLVTSGKGNWFPRGMPVARVTAAKRREPGREQDIEAQPTVDFSRLDAVLILPQATPPSDPRPQ
jgi:rod shape-determining protein MreC